MPIKNSGHIGPVTLRIPPDVAFDFDKLVRAQKELFELMGHGGCYSGSDIRVRIEDNWIMRGGRVQPALEA